MLRNLFTVLVDQQEYAVCNVKQSRRAGRHSNTSFMYTNQWLYDAEGTRKPSGLHVMNRMHGGWIWTGSWIMQYIISRYVLDYRSS